MDLTSDDAQTDAAYFAWEARLEATSERLRDAMSCKVCKDFFQSPVTLPCGHAMCTGCAKAWFKQRPNCPTCRQDVSKRCVETKARAGEEDFCKAVAAAQKTVEACDELLAQARAARSLAAQTRA
ncbi:hypothetical protein M885DRAFT_621993 [Pelagophyceae sp. CCMP2097]|nr:hypothetical protein M885DRAFT_621993 [Pelagophyceae sp. CCMP2097]